jgi:hypothetical protein
MQGTRKDKSKGRISKQSPQKRHVRTIIKDDDLVFTRFETYYERRTCRKWNNIDKKGEPCHVNLRLFLIINENRKKG